MTSATSAAAFPDSRRSTAYSTMTRAIAMDVSCLTRMALENRSDNRTEKLQRPLFDYSFTKKSVKSSQPVC
jgi:hypothetical protein